MKPIKFGILGAAAIAPTALIYPAKSHPEAVVYAVAARDKARAEAFAKKHNIPKAYDVYQGANLCYARTVHILTFVQDLLDDPEVDAIYNPVCPKS